MKQHDGILLLRSILRLHREKLKAPLRILGDKYVVNEFRLHAKTTNVNQLNLFYQMWRKYYVDLRGKTDKVGENLKKEDQAHLNAEQSRKLKELKDETLSFHKSDS